jgi:hypothetical protein
VRLERDFVVRRADEERDAVGCCRTRGGSRRRVRKSRLQLRVGLVAVWGTLHVLRGGILLESGRRTVAELKYKINVIVLFRGAVRISG